MDIRVFFLRILVSFAGIVDSVIALPSSAVLYVSYH